MMVDAYIKMRDALRSTGRPIVYSLCQYGNDAVWEWGASVGGNLWRTTGDINDHYVRMETIGFSQAGCHASRVQDTGTIPTCSKSVMAA